MKKKLIKNLDVKILSLVLACLLWIIVMNISDPVETKTIEDIPVTVINEDAIAEADKVYTIVSGDKVDITVKGPQSVVRKLNANHFTAIADLSKTSVVGAVIIDVKAPSQYEDKLTITTGKRNDAVMIISLEDKKTSSFRVTVKQKENEDGTQGADALEGYYVMAGENKPNMVQVTGAASVIDSIKEVVAEFDIKGRTYSFTDEVRPKIYNKYGYEVDASTVEMDADKIEVSVIILPTKQVPVKVSVKGTAYYGYEAVNVVSSPDYVTLAGEQEALDMYSIFNQYVDITLLKGDDETGILETQIDMKEIRGDELAENGLVIVDEDPKIAVKITFKKEGRQKIEILPSDIESRNVPEGKEVSFVTEDALTLEIKGYMEDDQLTAADVHPYIDLSGCTAGTTYQLDVRIEPMSEDIKKTGICRVSVMLVEAPEEE